ncbi:uncharacterized protein LOC111910386 [Lactuca sativa]|uniref:uncharacterized protein LOC111910386 n=1 Tax=Lactuca sativa TaxID=4236 RepID=UPI0022AF3385|nr:uncharacterized protein LOC111910386 [Lactuca sativa]
MMGSRRTNEKDQPPSFTNPIIQANCIAPNTQSTSNVAFQEANVSAGHFESIPDSPLLISPGWENMYSMNQPITQRMPETSGNPMAYLTNPSSFQNPQLNLNSSTANTDLQEVPLVPEWNTKWNPQFINQGHNAISAGGMNNGAVISNFDNPWSSKNPTTARNFAGDLQMNRQAGESKFGPFNRPQLDGHFAHSPLHYRPRDTAPIHTQNNVNFNNSQCGVQGKVERSFLSLGIGGTEEAIPTSQPGSRETSDKLKESASAELKMARARKAMGQTLNANFPGFQRSTSGFSNQLDRITSTGNEVGVHCTPNSGPGSSPYHILEMQQNDMQHGISRHDDSNSTFLSNRNAGYGDANHYRVSAGNQAVHSGTIGGNSAQFLNSQQHALNRVVQESAKPSYTMSHTPSGKLQNIRFKTTNTPPSESSMNSSLKLGSGSSSTRQNYAGKHPYLQNHMPSQGPGGGLLSQNQRTAVPQVSWVSSGQGVTDLPFPKRLGVEVNGRDSPQPAERQISLQTTSAGQSQTRQYPDNVVRPSIAPVSYPMNPQGPLFSHGQSQMVQLPNNPRGQAPTTSVDGLSNKSEYYARPYHKRSAVAPPSGPHWVQRQKMSHPTTTHHSTPIRFPTKPAAPVTANLAHPSIPIYQSQSQTQQRVRALMNPSIPYTSNFRPRVPVTAAPSPTVSHITWKDPETSPPELTKYKCLLCKRDLSLTSEGAVYQPTAPPAVAVLPCGHTFHDQCLQKITPQDQAKDPPCIPCAIGEN